jgi:lipopolysaccharide export LptBFGC system permease protein LptF
MSNAPNPINPQALRRATIAGAVLGVFGIVSFIVIWVLLGQAGAEQIPRLFLSLCIPPALIGVIMLAYIFYMRSRPRL